MRKFYFIVAAAIILLLPVSCAQEYFSNNKQEPIDMPGREQVTGFYGNGYTTLDDVESAAKLQDKHPDESFYGEHSYIIVDFTKAKIETKKKASKKDEEEEDEENNDDGEEEEDEDDTPKKKKKKNKKGKDKKYEDSLMKSPVMGDVYTETRLIALKDQASFREAVGYNDFQKVNNIKVAYGGSDLQWESPVILDVPYDGSGIFYSDGRLKAFGLSAPVLGTQLNYKYNVSYTNIKFLTSFYFQEDYFMKEKTIVFKVPDWLEIDIIEKNFAGYDITKSDKIPSYLKSKIKDGTSASSDDDEEAEEEEEEKPKKKGKKKPKSKKEKNTYKYVVYTANNLKPYKYERGSPGHSYELPHILIVCKSYQDENKKTVNMMRNVGDLYGWYKSLIKDMDNDTAELKKFTTQLVANEKTDMAKIEKVFYWVQDNIRYIAFEDGIAGFKPDACQNVFEKRYGDCKGMANLTANMLKTLGYDARLTWIGTRHIAYDYSIPSVAVDNHMICTIYIGGKRYFLDPTESYIAMGDYGHRIQGKQVLIENGDTFVIDTIPDLGYQRNKEEKTVDLTINGVEINGKARLSLKGESKVMIMNGVAETKTDRRSSTIDRYLSDENVNVKVKNVKSTDLTDRKNDVVFNFDFTLSKQVIKINNDLYVNPDYEQQLYHFDFDTSKRVSSYDFETNIYIEEIDNIEIPAGYKVKYLPPAVETENKHYLIALSYKQEGNKIKYFKKIIFKNGTLPRSEFPQWNTVNEKMKNFYNDFIILTR